MIGEIGYYEGYKFGVEYKIKSNYRIDSVWFDINTQKLTHAFEINFKGNVEKDIIALKTAFEQFHCKCILISSPEILVKGKSIMLMTFPELVNNFKFISYEKITDFYQISKNHLDVKNRLGLNN